METQAKTFVTNKEVTKIKKRNNGIELLRFIAITIVIFSHFCNVHEQTQTGWKYVGDGAFGVMIFLLISGVYNCNNLKHRTLKMLVKTIIYSIGGFLVLLILFCCHVTNTMFQGMFLSPGKYSSGGFLYFFLILTIFQPYINKFIMKVNKGVMLSLILLLYCILIISILGPSYEIRYLFISPNKLMLFLFCYSLGAWFGIHYKNKIHDAKPIKGLGILLFFAATLAFYCCYRLINSKIVVVDSVGIVGQELVKNTAFALCSMGLIVLCDNLPLIKINGLDTTFKGLGQISLPLYLTHAITGVVGDLVYPPIPATFNSSYYLGKFFAHYFVAIAISLIIYLFISIQEKGFWNFYQKLKNKKQSNNEVDKKNN